MMRPKQSPDRFRFCFCFRFRFRSKHAANPDPPTTLHSRSPSSALVPAALPLSIHVLPSPPGQRLHPHQSNHLVGAIFVNPVPPAPKIKPPQHPYFKPNHCPRCVVPPSIHSLRRRPTCSRGRDFCRTQIAQDAGRAGLVLGPQHGAPFWFGIFSDMYFYMIELDVQKTIKRKKKKKKPRQKGLDISTVA